PRNKARAHVPSVLSKRRQSSERTWNLNLVSSNMFPRQHKCTMCHITLFFNAYTPIP
ncbi:hypothetical protein H0H87_009614, partial [Tephrocybe sp. NHM501043]